MPHATATFNGKTIAESDTFEFVEDNVYVKVPHGALQIKALTRLL